MSKKTPQRRAGKSHRGFEQAIRERPRDATPRLIYADWLEEQGEEEAARMQRIKAKQCTRFDPDFDYRSCLKKLRLAGKVRVERIAFGEIVRFNSTEGDFDDWENWDWSALLEEQGGNEEGIERFCDSARMQVWLQEQVAKKKGNFSDSNEAMEWFWEHVPGVRESVNVKGKQFAAALQRAFEDSNAPDERKSRKTTSRSVGKGYSVERTGRKKPSWHLKGGRVRRLVWSAFWDSGSPWAGAGTEEVYEIGGRYYHTDSSSGDRFGPHKTLLALLEECGLNWVNSATVSIDSPLFSAEEIAAMLKMWEDVEKGYGLTINGEEWVWVAPGILQRAESDGEE